MFTRQLRRGALQNVRPSAAVGSGTIHNSFFGLRSSVYSQNRFMSFKPDKGLNKPAGGAQSTYVDQMYSQWRADPSSVDPAWQEYFSSPAQSTASSPSSASQSEVDAIVEALKASGLSSGGQLDSGAIMKAQSDGAKLSTYIRAFMTHGHMFANLDPL